MRFVLLGSVVVTVVITMSARWFAVLACATLTTACGGGGIDALAPSASATALPKADVAIYGDSTTRAECQPLTLIGHCPASMAQPLLTVSLGQEGVGGSAAYHLLAGIDGVHTVPFEKTIAAQSARIVIFRYGINDVKLYSSDRFAQIMDTMVTLAESAGKRVIIQTPTPVTQADLSDGVAQNAQAMRVLAEAHPRAVLCDLYAMAQAGGDAGALADGIHRNPTGVTLDGQRTADCIRSL